MDKAICDHFSRNKSSNFLANCQCQKLLIFSWRNIIQALVYHMKKNFTPTTLRADSSGICLRTNLCSMIGSFFFGGRRWLQRSIRSSRVRWPASQLVRSAASGSCPKNLKPIGLTRSLPPQPFDFDLVWSSSYHRQSSSCIALFDHLILLSALIAAIFPGFSTWYRFA